MKMEALDVDSSQRLLSINDFNGTAADVLDLLQ